MVNVWLMVVNGLLNRFPARHGGTPKTLDGLFHGKSYWKIFFEKWFVGVPPSGKLHMFTWFSHHCPVKKPLFLIHSAMKQAMGPPPIIWCPERICCFVVARPAAFMVNMFIGPTPAIMTLGCEKNLHDTGIENDFDYHCDINGDNIIMMIIRTKSSSSWILLIWSLSLLSLWSKNSNINICVSYRSHHLSDCHHSSEKYVMPNPD